MPICESEHWSLAIICFPGNLEKIINDHIEECINPKPKASEKTNENTAAFGS